MKEKVTNTPAEVPEADFYGRRLAQQAELRAWRLKQRGELAVRALRRNGFEAHFVATAAQATQAVLEAIPAGATVGVGGSVTVRQLGVVQALGDAGHTLYDHWAPGLSKEAVFGIRRAQLTCDVFLASVNALTLEGQLVSVDAFGNRTAAMMFGPHKVVLAVGAQKIVPDLEAALARLRDVCAPLALRESGADLACVQDGVCSHCKSEGRLCRATAILDCQPLCTETTVFVIGKEIGF
ncbi:MAG: lactate utilization protein [Candidatus Hydrogenedentota bacterium]